MGEARRAKDSRDPTFTRSRPRSSVQAKLAEAKRPGYMADATEPRTKALMKICSSTRDITKARQKERTAPGEPVEASAGAEDPHPGAVVTTAGHVRTIVQTATGIGG